MSVIEEVCCVKGHDIESHIVGDAVDPVNKIVVHRYDYRCTQCGKTLPEIEKYKLSSRGKARQKKEVKNEQHHGRPSSPTPRTGTEAEDVNSVPKSIPGSEPSVLEPEV